MSYQYGELKDEQFRVAHLKPGDGPICVEVSVEKVSEAEDYDALSWQWGSIDLAHGSTINVGTKDDAGSYQQIVVRPNLLQALESFRRNSPVYPYRRLWVDMICINQGNSNEKERQVAIMAKYIQKSSTKLEVAVQSIDTLGNLDDAKHIGNVDIGIQNKAVLYNLEPLFKLLRRGWFSRRWIVQEIGVSKDKATVHCGDKEFSWAKLANAVALLERIGRDGSIDRLFKLRPESRHVSEYMGNISALPVYRLVQNVSGLYREISKDRKEEQYSLEQLVCFLVIFESSEPKDIIYAVLGIASDVEGVQDPNRSRRSLNLDPTRKKPFPVQYQGKKTLRVYTEFVEHAIQQSKSLDILCRPWAPKDPKDPKDKTKLPSWILDLNRKPFQATSRGKMVRYNADPFVGPAVRKGGFYAASGTCVNNDSFKIDHGDQSRVPVLTVGAFPLAELNEIWDVAVRGSIPASWLKGAEWDDAEKQSPDEFWRTMVADRTNAGLDPEPGYSSIIQSAVRERGLHYGINTNEFIHEKDNQAYYEVFRRVQAVVWNRKLVRTKLCNNGNEPPEPSSLEPLALVPAETVKDDKIYIVEGCSVPLVLRKKANVPQDSSGPENAGDIYTLIGECYINNMMDGRAMPGKFEPYKIE
ncbi:heterokaryon incompatibility protein-domain-containing protein [Hypoxylon sp. NC1633]|nr:heterokaryon incompatibility protein-domain-containing protein [Hypoxylon sp. NC1633]